jgi:asparagine synthetase B (glutamine-hydrolysing)
MQTITDLETHVDGETLRAKARAPSTAPRFSLAGRIPCERSDLPDLERGGHVATFPAAWRDGELEIAVDGWFVRDGRLVVDGMASRHAIADAARTDLATWLGGLSNGAFNIVVHDRQRRRTLVASDRRGMLPLFLCRRRTGWHLASDYATLFARIGGRPTIDRLGAAEVYLVGYPIGDRTPFAGVVAMPPGTISVFDWDGGGRSDQRWATAAPPQGAAGPARLDDLLDEVVETAERAVAAFDVPDQPFSRLGIKLSAGMDSRLIGAAWRGAPLSAYTFGEPSSAEVRISAKLANALDFPHRVVGIEGDLFEQVYEAQAERFAMAEWFHAVLAPAMVEDGVHATFDGLGGDVLIGGLTLKRKGSRARMIADALGLAAKASKAPTDDLAIARFMFGQIRLPDADFPVLSQAARSEIEGMTEAAIEDLAAQVATFRGEAATFEQLYTRIMLNNRTRRHVAMQGAVCRPDVESFYPFLDEAFAKLAARIPIELSSGKRLYIELFSRRFPKVRHVPAVMSLLPFTVPPRAHYLGRIARYGYDLALKKATRAGSNRMVNSVQWELWFRRNAAMREGLTRFVAGSSAVDPTQLGRVLAEIASGRRIARGTRIMYSASYLALLT